MKGLTALLTLALIAAPLSAQEPAKTAPTNIAGNWDISFVSPQGAATWRIKFEQSADTLWGTATTDFGPINVADGWVAGADVSFTLNLNFQGQAIALNFTGTAKGDTINGQIDVPGVGIQPFAFTGVKVVGATVAAPAPLERPRPVAVIASRR